MPKQALRHQSSVGIATGVLSPVDRKCAIASHPASLQLSFLHGGLVEGGEGHRLLELRGPGHCILSEAHGGLANTAMTLVGSVMRSEQLATNPMRPRTAHHWPYLEPS